jgi:hypothetical protein
MTLESKLRALVAGMRYAADCCDGYATEATDYTLRERDLARARAMRSDANALEAVLDAHVTDEATRAAR